MSSQIEKFFHITRRSQRDAIRGSDQTGKRPVKALKSLKVLSFASFKMKAMNGLLIITACNSFCTDSVSKFALLFSTRCQKNIFIIGFGDKTFISHFQI